MSHVLPRGVWLAVAAGLVARLVFGLAYWVDKPLTHDEREYLLLAHNVAAGRGFAYVLADGSPAPGEHFGRAPAYPAFLAGLVAATGSRLAPGTGDTGVPVSNTGRLVTAIKIAQSLIGAAIIWLVARIALGTAGPRAATAAAWIAACYPPLVWMPAYVFSETLYGVLALGCAACLDASLPDGGGLPFGTPGAGRRVLAAGALAGLGVLTRPVMLFFVLLAVPWLWRARGIRAAAAFATVALLVVSPWTARNVAAYGRFVLVASEGGITFWTGNHPLAIGEGDMAANTEIKRANIGFRARHAGLSPEALEPLYYREALDWISANPGAAAALVARKAFYSVVPVGPSYRLHSPLYFWASVIAYLSLLPFAIAGFVAAAGRAPAARPLLLMALASLAVCLIFFPQERFRIPVIDPALVVCAAAWWAARRTARRQVRGGAAGAEASV